MVAVLAALVLLGSAGTPETAGSCAAAEGEECSHLVTCEEFLKMRVLEEVRAIGSGRVPQECRDAKMEHQRREQRRRKHMSSPQTATHTVAPQLAQELRPLREVLRQWPLDQLEPPAGYHMPIPRLDYATQSDEAMRLRLRDMPFILRGVPDLSATTATWAGDLDATLRPLFGDKQFVVTRSDSASFL
jgi:hypothetical protein